MTEVCDIEKKIAAARTYDNKTHERRNYWGELSVWASRQIGLLLIEAKVSAGRPKENAATLAGLLGTETDNQAQHISKRAQKLAAIPEAKIQAAIGMLRESGEEVSKAAVQRVAANTHVANNAGNNEWYTPPAYIELARQVMGGIDLDPASSEIANQTVQAERYFTAETNGLEHPWQGRVWMNPPYAQPLIGQFCKKLADEVESGNVAQACVLVNNATETEWFGRLAETSIAVLFPNGRVKFTNPDGNPGAPLQGQALIYIGPESARFADSAGHLGVCWRK